MRILILFLMWVPCLCLSQMKTGTFSELETIQNKKPVIIHVYTDWCGICKIEKHAIEKDKDLINMINENFYVIQFEAEKTKNTIHFQGKYFHYLPNGNSGIHELALTLSQHRNQPVYPLWIFLDKNQQLLYYHEGIFTPEKMKQKLLEISASNQ
ncbi:thioredoxin fold domain-containing protein [Chryseobacterium sp. SIMBA_029]|uniref:thioredoxin fold domain-containing protein n=1 Tax=Chryseobacterium sp. SIMBA_029 TaxID=3085772 RepID=UPI00397BFFDA